MDQPQSNTSVTPPRPAPVFAFPPKLTDEDRRKLKEEWQKMYEGTNAPFFLQEKYGVVDVAIAAENLKLIYPELYDYLTSSRDLVGMVKEFHEKYRVALPDSPGFPDQAIRTARRKFLAEEYIEYDDAEAASDLVEVADALADQVYIAIGTALCYGIDFARCFAEVHRSNMSKLGNDGEPVLRQDGKIMKGPNYSPPDLSFLLKENVNDNIDSPGDSVSLPQNDVDPATVLRPSANEPG